MNNGYGASAIGGVHPSRLAEMAEKARYAEAAGQQLQPAVPVSELARELNRLESSLGGLNRTIEELLVRLNPVTLPPPAELACGNGGAEPSCGSILASNVQSVRCGFEAATARLNMLLGSLAI